MKKSEQVLTNTEYAEQEAEKAANTVLQERGYYCSSYWSAYWSRYWEAYHERF